MAEKEEGAAKENKDVDDGAGEEPVDKEASEKSKDLWQIILSHSKEAMIDQTDHNVIFVGSKQSGKSTLIQRFLHRDDQSVPKPTTALEYCHKEHKARDVKGVKMGHFWELGGGTSLAGLLDVVITPENIHNCLFVICVDLTEGREVWESLKAWIKALSDRVRYCFGKLKDMGRSTPQRMCTRMIARFGDKHPDLEANAVKIIGVPIIIAATKYDVFKDQGSESAKIMARSLRYFAHSYAATLIYTSSKDEKEMGKFRQLISHLVFSTPFKSAIYDYDHNKPLLIFPGQDSLKDIGSAPSVTKPANFVSSGNEELDKWKMAFDTVFPPAKDGGSKKEEYDVYSSEYAEREVDATRSVKDDELTQYRQRRKRVMEEAARREAQARVAA